MGIFFRNTKVNSDEYEKLTKKIIDLNATVEEIKKKFEVLTTNYNSLRGLINRKLTGKDLEEDQSQGLNNSVILPDNGTIFRNR
jgi:hypothetical protein